MSGSMSGPPVGYPSPSALRRYGRPTATHADGSRTWISADVWRTAAVGGRDCNEWRMYTDRYGYTHVIPEHVAPRMGEV